MTEDNVKGSLDIVRQSRSELAFQSNGFFDLLQPCFLVVNLTAHIAVKKRDTEYERNPNNEIRTDAQCALGIWRNKQQKNQTQEQRPDAYLNQVFANCGDENTEKK